MSRKKSLVNYSILKLIAVALVVYFALGYFHLVALPGSISGNVQGQIDFAVVVPYSQIVDASPHASVLCGDPATSADSVIVVDHVPTDVSVDDVNSKVTYTPQVWGNAISSGLGHEPLGILDNAIVFYQGGHISSYGERCSISYHIVFTQNAVVNPPVNPPVNTTPSCPIATQYCQYGQVLDSSGCFIGCKDIKTPKTDYNTLGGAAVVLFIILVAVYSITHKKKRGRR